MSSQKWRSTQDTLDAVLTGLGPLVLVDVGASGGPPRIWHRLAKHAVFVGFDPDAREINESHAGGFARAVYVNKAVTGTSTGSVRFYLTRSPYCSSTLKPDTRVTESFLSADSFLIEGERTMPAVTVADALASLGHAHVDWLKLDTQGTDLSIFRSIPDQMRDGILAADLEPGLRGAYVGEELFSEVHRVMLREGFWLSRMDVLGLPRMRKSTLDRLTAAGHLTEGMVEQTVRKTPGWVECRYLRTIESLAEREAPQRAYALLWSFAFIDQQWGFCSDIAGEFAARFPGSTLALILEEAPLEAIGRASHPPGGLRRLLSRAKRRLSRSLGGGVSSTAAAL
jgi:FkbM family methyltransferase